MSLILKDLVVISSFVILTCIYFIIIIIIIIIIITITIITIIIIIIIIYSLVSEVRVPVDSTLGNYFLILNKGIYLSI